MTKSDRLLLVGYAAALVAGALAIHVHFRLPAAPPPLSQSARLEALRFLRASMEGERGQPRQLSSPEMLRTPAGPVFVSVYLDGHVVWRRRGDGATLATAIRAASPAALHPMDAARARVQVDLVQGESAVLSGSPLLFAFGVRPGMDGLVARQSGREIWMLPGDLIERGLLTGLAPFAFMEFEFGLDVPALQEQTHRAFAQAGVSSAADVQQRSWHRFSTESFVESMAPEHDPLPVARGNVPGPKLDRETMMRAARAGGSYLLGKLRADDNSFEYEYDTAQDEDVSGTYSLPRHFGAAMFLAQLARVTQAPAFRDGARRAFSYIKAHERELFEYTGSAALAVLALTEYRAVEGDGSFDQLLRRLGKLLLERQKPEGDFVHDKSRPAQKDLYVDGEGAFALVRLARTFGDRPYVDGARRALDWLTTRAYDHFAGQFYFGEDHWTCIAAEAAWPAIDAPAYQRFCDSYAEFLRRQQFVAGEGPDDFTGAYGFSPFFPPHSTPAASRTEAMAAAYLLGRHRGHPDEATRQQVLRSVRYLLAQQLRPENDWMVTCPERAHGGWMQSPLRRFVRIDFVQHAGDALIRATELLDD